MNFAGIIAADESQLAQHPDIPFGDIVIQPSRLRVLGPRGEVRIEPKGMVVLLLLANAGDETLSREIIYRQVWGNVFVGEDSLNRAIHIARKAVRDTSHRVAIETIRGLGYRLTFVEAAGAGPTGEEQRQPGIPAGSTGLTRRGVLAGIGAVGAAGVTGWALWRERRRSEAQRLVADARSALRTGAPEQIAAAVAMLRRATEVSPGSAQAWGMLSYGLVGEAGEPDNSAEADRAAGNALAIDSREPLARLARADLRAGLVDWRATENEYRAVLARHPESFEALDSLGYFLQGVGRGQESWAAIERASTIDPIAPAPQYKRAIKLWIMGRMTRCDQVADRALQLWPRHPWVWNARFMTFAFSGREGAARAMLADRAGHPEQISAAALATWRKGLDALASPTARNIAAAREAFFAAAPRSPGMAVHGIMTLAALDDVDSAYSIMDMLVLNRGPLARPAAKEKSKRLLSDANWRKTQWLFTPATTSVREHSRFADFAEQSGLSGYWRRSGVRPDPVRTLRA